MKMEQNSNVATLKPLTGYCGVRKRKWGKWVSEIREPGKKTRIWLGSFDSAEAAATAHDVAARCLQGCRAQLNFPDAIDQLPRPVSSNPDDIRTAALEAAAQVRFRPGPGNVSAEKLLRMSCGLGNDELGLDSPKLWAELAEALLLAPPMAMYPCEVGEPEEMQQQGSLWDAFY